MAEASTVGNPRELSMGQFADSIGHSYRTATDRRRVASVADAAAAAGLLSFAMIAHHNRWGQTRKTYGVRLTAGERG